VTHDVRTAGSRPKVEDEVAAGVPLGAHSRNQAAADRCRGSLDRAKHAQTEPLDALILTAQPVVARQERIAALP
jgi:hypothetical protein